MLKKPETQRQDIKNTLKNIILGIVWTVLAVYAMAFVLLRIPAIQTAIASGISSELGEMLGTRVSIGKVDIRLFNRVVADDVLIYDQNQQRMLHAARISAGIELLPLLHSQIKISSAQLFGMKANIYRNDSISPLNCQFAIDSLASRDTTSQTPLDLSIASLIIRNGSITYNQHDKPKGAGHFTPYHISASHISSHLILYSLTDDSLHVLLKRLSFREASGLQLDNLTAEARYSPGSISLDDLKLQMPGTSLIAPHIAAQYAMEGKRLVPGSLRFTGKATAERVSPHDFSAFIPHELVQSLPVMRLGMSAEGNDRHAEAGLSVGSIGSEELAIEMRAEARNITKNPTGELALERLFVSERLATALQKACELPAMLCRTGGIEARGTVQYLGNKRFAAKAGINAPQAGTVEISGNCDANNIKARIETADMNVAQLLDDQRFGTLKCALDIEAGADNSGKPTTATAKGSIGEVEYNGYTYRDISLDCGVNGNKVNGKVSIGDPNLTLSAEGKGDMGRIKSLDAVLSVTAFAPKALNLSDIFDDNTFALNATAGLCGTSIDDLLGQLTVSDISITSQHNASPRHNAQSGIEGKEQSGIKGSAKDGMHIKRISLTSTIDDSGQKLVELRSDFANARLSGRQTPSRKRHAQGSISGYDVDATIESLDIVRYLFNAPVEIGKPLAINGFVSTKGHSSELALSAPSVTAGGLEFRNTEIRISPIESGWGGMLQSSFEIGDTLWTITSDGIDYTDNRLTVNKLRVGNENQHVILNGTASKAATDSLVAELYNVNVGYVLNIVDFHSVEFNGTASGTAVAHNVLGELKAKAHLDVSNFTFEDGHLGTLHADATYSNATKQIDIDAIADHPEAGGKTFILGYIAPQHGLDLDIRAENSCLEFLHTYCDSFLSGIDLHGTGRLRLHGPFSALDLVGTMTGYGACTLTSTNCRYSLEHALVRLTADGILFNKAPIKDRYGNMAYLDGGIYHRNFSGFSYGLTATTQRLLAFDIPTLDGSTFCGRAMVNGSVGINGRGNEVGITADVTPLRGSYLTYDASSPDAIASQDFITWGSLAQGSAPERTKAQGGSDDENDPNNSGNNRTNIRMNFMVNATPEARLHLLMDAATGDYVDLYGAGMLRVNYYNKGSLDIFGNYTIDHGTYKMTIQNLLRRDFAFQPGGTIGFGGDPYNATLRMQAAYTLNSVSLADLNIGTSFKSNNVPVNCLMNISGTPAKPVVAFDLDLPSLSSDARQMVYSVINSEEEMNQQVLYLLGIGRFYSQSSSNNDNAGRTTSQSSLAMQSFLSGTLTQQLNNMLSNVIGSSNWSFGANITPGTDGFNNAEYEGLLSGRLLNNRLIFNGQFGYRDNVMTNSQSFIGDFTLQYLLTPNGNFSLKVYNQSNDRYFTRNSLNTQGIGVVLQKEFGR